MAHWTRQWGASNPSEKCIPFVNSCLVLTCCGSKHWIGCRGSFHTSLTLAYLPFEPRGTRRQSREVAGRGSWLELSHTLLLHSFLWLLLFCDNRYQFPMYEAPTKRTLKSHCHEENSITGEGSTPWHFPQDLSLSRDGWASGSASHVIQVRKSERELSKTFQKLGWKISFRIIYLSETWYPWLYMTWKIYIYRYPSGLSTSWRAWCCVLETHKWLWISKDICEKGSVPVALTGFPHPSLLFLPPVS